MVNCNGHPVQQENNYITKQCIQIHIRNSIQAALLNLSSNYNCTNITIMKTNVVTEALLQQCTHTCYAIQQLLAIAIVCSKVYVYMLHRLGLVGWGASEQQISGAGSLGAYPRSQLYGFCKKISTFSNCCSRDFSCVVSLQYSCVYVYIFYFLPLHLFSSYS